MSKCNICGSEKVDLYMKGIFDSESTSVHECTDCGLQFLSPMMTDKEEEDYYRNYYENQSVRHYKKFSMEDIQRQALKHYEEYLNVYSDLLKNSRRVLEIGSGTGGFLKFASRQFPNINLCSIERSESNKEFLKDSFSKEAREVTFFDDIRTLANSEKFDLIVAFGVLEHVKDTIGFISSLVAHLEPNGLLAFNVPNKRTTLVELYGLEEFTKFTYMKQHYYTFSEKALELVGARCGLVVEKFNYMQVWSLDNHLSWLKNRKPMDFSSFTKVLSKETISRYNKDMIDNKLTDLMMVVYKNNNK